MGMKPGEGHQVTDNGQQDISAIPMSQDQRKVCKRMKEYEMNRVKVKVHPIFLKVKLSPFAPESRPHSRSK